MLTTIFVSRGSACRLSWPSSFARRGWTSLTYLSSKRAIVSLYQSLVPVSCPYRPPLSHRQTRNCRDEDTLGATGITRFGRTDRPQIGLTLFAVPALAAVRFVSEADPNPAAAIVTVKQHVRDVNRHLAREASPLGTFGMAASHMLVDPIDPFDDNFA